jgi:general nucleoside transport system ATP-binding protein
MDLARGADRVVTKPAPVLSLIGIERSFPGVQALDGATLHVRPGTVHALLGENGAGKTTLMRIAFGLEHADAGELHVDGRRARIGDPADAIALGIGMVHQHFSSVPRMTVAENVALGGAGRLALGGIVERIHEIGRVSGLHVEPFAMAADLSVAGQSRLEIVKALARGARILILDEPTGALAPAEAAELLNALRRLAQGGAAVVLITHKLREALTVSDEITVLRGGRTVLHTTRGDVDARTLTTAMFGDGKAPAADDPGVPASSDRAIPADPAAVLVMARHLTLRDALGRVRLRSASFSVRPGEIVGVAGVEGSGHFEMLRAVAGRLPAASGTLRKPRNVAFIPEDRQGEGLLLDRPLHENVALRDAARWRGRMPWRAIIARTRALLTGFGVHAPSHAVPARMLSGGNQQKLVLARELEGAPPLIVAENPTRGLDLEAAAAIHARLLAARNRGAGVLLHSTDLDELLALADRLLVTYAGAVQEVLRDRDVIGAAMLGVGAGGAGDGTERGDGG